MNTGEILCTAVSAVGVTAGANDMATILEATGTVSVPAVVVTAVNVTILLVNAGIAIYKKIKALKTEIKHSEQEEAEEDKNGND